MKINQIQKISEIYGASSVRKVSKNEIKAKGKDELKISEQAKYFQLAYKAAKEAPEIRDEKVDSIKSRINSGTYNVSSEQVAERLMSQVFNKLV